jgi:hypothetical protein
MITEDMVEEVLREIEKKVRRVQKKLPHIIIIDLGKMLDDEETNSIGHSGCKYISRMRIQPIQKLLLGDN